MANKKLDALIAGIQHKQSSPSVASTSEVTVPDTPSVADDINPKKSSRKKAKLSAHGEILKPQKASIYKTVDDEARMRELLLFLTSQGRKATESSIFRTGLWSLMPGDTLLKAHDTVLGKDGRKRD